MIRVIEKKVSLRREIIASQDNMKMMNRCIVHESGMKVSLNVFYVQ